MARVPRRPVCLWGVHRQACWGRDATFAIGAAWAHWAVMHRLSSGHCHIPSLCLAAPFATGGEGPVMIEAIRYL